jgi:hypothetical protein
VFGSRKAFLRARHRLAPTGEAFVETVAAPYVSRVLARARQRGLKSEIGAVDLPCLLGEPRIHQQRADAASRALANAPTLPRSITIQGESRQWSVLIERPIIFAQEASITRDSSW